MSDELPQGQHSMAEDVAATREREVFFPFMADKRKWVLEQSTRFAYYTTADTACRILQNEEIWMRSTLTMNDFSEVEHGLACVSRALESQAGVDFSSALDSCFEGAFAEVRRYFAPWAPTFPHDTFIACLSEHDVRDDQFGRLSMWRAYGGSAGVALIFNGQAMFSDLTALAAHSSPVGYLDESGVEAQLGRVGQQIKDNETFVRGLGQHRVVGTVLQALRFAAVCTKHPAFSEEREWRVISSPAMLSSPLLLCDVETVKGVPQRVLKLKLKSRPDLGLEGLDLKTLISRLIIGPCEYPGVVYQALRQIMLAKGFSENEFVERVAVSNIPLRLQ